jgi:hypothetical protein
MAKDQHHVSVKLPPELRQHLKTYKASRGKRSLKAVVVEILENHFRSIHSSNQPQTIDSSIGRIATLEAKVTYLSEQVEALKQAIATPQADTSSPGLGAVTSARQSSSDSDQPKTGADQLPSEVPGTVDDDDDDMYDEPDEILYSFLEP